MFIINPGMYSNIMKTRVATGHSIRHAITAKIIKSGTRLKRQGGKIDVYDTLIDVALADIGQQVQLAMAQSVDVVIDKWRI